MNDTTAAARNGDIWLACLALLTLLRLILAGSLNLAPDEAYYWLWSLHLQGGYYDHPPMVAIFIRAGTSLAGASPFGIRLFAPFAAAGGSCLLWRAAEDFYPGRRAGLTAAGLFNATLAAGAGAVIITPDTPLLLFWSAALAAAGRLSVTKNGVWWLGIGTAAGLALLSKYSGALLIAGLGFWLLTSPHGRRQLATPWPWAGLILAFAIFLPDLLWNGLHHWISYLKQGSRAAHFAPSRAGQFLAELGLGQIGLVTPIVFGLFCAGLWRLRHAPGDQGRLLLWLSVFPSAVFLTHAFSERVQGNWPAIIYPAASIAAARLPIATLRRWLKPALALGLAINLLVYAHCLAGFPPIPPARDPAALQLAGWNRFTKALAGRPAAFITSNDYATTAELAFHAPAGSTVVGFDPRWRYLAFPSARRLAGKAGILVTRRSDTACPIPLGLLTRQAAEGPVMTYRLCRVTAPETGSLLPERTPEHGI